MRNISGCYRCECRQIGCHSNCLVYAQYKQYLQKIKDRKEQEKLTYPLKKRRRVYDG